MGGKCFTPLKFTDNFCFHDLGRRREETSNGWLGLVEIPPLFAIGLFLSVPVFPR